MKILKMADISDSSMNALINLIKEALDRLNDTISSSSASANSNTSKLADELKKISAKVNQSGTGDQSQDIRGMAEDITKAFSSTYSKGEDSLLSKQDKIVTVLSQILEEDKKPKISQTASAMAGDAKRSVQEIISNVSKGDISMGIFSKLSNAIAPNLEMYQKMAGLGQGFEGSIINMRNTMNQSGLQMQDFLKVWESGSQGMRMLGTSTFSAFSSSVMTAAKNLGSLGLSIDDTARYMSIYMEGVRNSGKMGTLTTQQMTDGMRDFVMQATGMAHDLGISRDEAAQRMNDLSKAPDLQFLMRNDSSQSQKQMEGLIGRFSNGDANLQRMFSSALMRATGNGVGLMDVMTNVGSTGTSRQYDQIVATLSAFHRGQIDQTQANSRIADSMVAMTKIANSDTSGAAIRYQGASTGNSPITQSGFAFQGSLLSLNAEQIRRNMQTAPTAGQLSGNNDPMLKGLEQRQQLQNSLIVSYESAITKFMNSNQEFITNMIKVENSALQEMSKLVDVISSKLAPITGSVSSMASPVLNGMANHPLLTMLGMGALSHTGGSLIRSTANFARSLLTSRSEASIVSIFRSTIGRIPGIFSTIPRLFGGIISPLGTAFRSIPGLFVRALGPLSSLTSALPTLFRSLITKLPLGALAGGAGLTAASMATGAMGGTMLGGYLTGTNYGSILQSHQANETAQQAQDLDRNKWKAWGGSIGGIGGGVLGGVLGAETGPGALATSLLGSTLGSSAFSYGAGKLYDWTHTSINTPTTNIRPGNGQSPDDATKPKSPEDILSDQLTKIADLITSGNSSSASNLSSIGNKIDDLNRTVKISGNRVW